MFASSSAASTSSRTQNGTGRTSSIANSSATAVSARSPPDSIASACGFLPGGRATISMPVEPEVGRVGQRQPGEAAAEQLLEAGREGGLERGERRPEPIRDHRVELGDQLARPDDRGPQVGRLRLERLEPRLERRVLVDRVRIDRAELVEAAAELAEPAGLGGGRRRWLGRPDRRDEREGRLEGGGLVGDGVRRPSSVGVEARRRSSASVAAMAASVRPAIAAAARRAIAEVAEPGELDDDALVQRLEPEPRLELDVVRGAQPGVGGTQRARARPARVAFGRGEPVAVGRVGGMRPRRAASRAPPRAAAVAATSARSASRSLGQRALAFAQRRRRRDPRGPSAPRP